MATTGLKAGEPKSRARRGAAAASLPGREAGHAVENAEVARVFREVADLLEVEEAHPFRARAYRAAARTVEEMPESIDGVVRGSRRPAWRR